MGRPHVVILGAGASLAAFPNGDKFGRTLPLMNNLIDVLNLKDILKNCKSYTESKNFEEVYSELFSVNKYKSLLSKIEGHIYNYFSELEIPDNPTVYDHLALSLRDKDLIATFNWDPFLMRAYARNRVAFDLPRLAFLHGNVEIGYCEAHRTKGPNGTVCRKCKQPFTPTKLLYPINQKNYRNETFISGEWIGLEKSLKDAYILTISGYSAPKTDFAAIDIMKKAWEENSVKQFLETEIIDVKDKGELKETWNNFTFDLHYEIYDDFYNSFLAKHPRRTCEALWNQTMEVQFLEDNNIPRDYAFNELWDWLAPLKEAEDNNK